MGMSSPKMFPPPAEVRGFGNGSNLVQQAKPFDQAPQQAFTPFSQGSFPTVQSPNSVPSVPGQGGYYQNPGYGGQASGIVFGPYGGTSSGYGKQPGELYK